MIEIVPGLKSIRGRLNRMRQSEEIFRRRVWQRLHNPSGRSLPVFLVGCGRSGTSMTVRHLSRSWRIELFNEDHPAAFQRWRLRPLSAIQSLVDQSYAEVVLFKPILDTYRTNVLLSRFPTAKVIFAFRHFDDVINSFAKRFGPLSRLHHVTAWMNEDFSEFAAAPPPDVTRAFIKSQWKPSLGPDSAAALYWLFYNRLYFDLHLDRNERVRLLRYESVVSHPVAEFERLCCFLGIPFEPQITGGIFTSSIRRAPPPDIDPQIQAECDALWQRLCNALAIHA